MTGPLIVARAIHFVSAVTAFGGVLFLYVVVDPAFGGKGTAFGSAAGRLRRRLRGLASIALGVAVASGVAWLVLLAAAITGTSVADVVSANTAWTLLTDTQFGRVWSVRAVIAAFAAVALLRLDPQGGRASRGMAALAAVLTGCFLGSLAWAGHSGGESGFSGDIRVIVDSAHLLAAGAWVGGLVPLALLLAMTRGSPAADPIPTSIAAEATARFSLLGVVTVATLLATGVLNTWSLVGGVPQLVGTNYGRLLLVKIALFVAMVGVAAYNRLSLVPRLSAAGPDRSVVLHRLQQDSLAEVVLGLLILSIVGLLGATAPAAHSEPLWPFSVRFDVATLSDAGMRVRLAVAAGAIVLGAVLVLCGLWLRRWRWPLLAAGVALVAWFFADLRLLTVEAFPTSFYVSPTGYTAESITAGKRLYAAHCAACHGPDGEGNGPAAKALSTPPSDLTANHIYDHRDGDLFWWIGNGIGHAMPGFSASLDEQGRWNLIDFIHANADAPRLRGSIGEVTSAAYPAPDFSVECQDGSTPSIRDLRGHVVHVVLAGPAAAERLRHLSALEPHDDVTAIAVALDPSSAKDIPICVVRDPDVVTTLALYAGRDETDADGIELLIDAAGQLRSIWYPKQRRPDWSDPAAFDRVVEQLKQTPVSPAPSAPHLHVH